MSSGYGETFWAINLFVRLKLFIDKSTNKINKIHDNYHMSIIPANHNLFICRGFIELDDILLSFNVLLSCTTLTIYTNWFYLS